MKNTQTRVLPYARQQIDDDDIAAVTAVLRSDYLTTGPMVEKFEKALAEKLNAKYAVVCSSGTAALHLSTLALGLGIGDSVIVPSMTFAATANAAALVGAKVIFTDVDSETGLIDVSQIEAHLREKRRERVRAILPVHLNGQCSDMESVSELAGKHGLKVIEDACHAIGATYSNREGSKHTLGSCRHSDLCVFSFHAVKSMTAGEGGAITTNNKKLYERLMLFRNHGITRTSAEFQQTSSAIDANSELMDPWYYEMKVLGLNYRLSDIHCALGLSQLSKLNQFIQKRSALVGRYNDLLAPLSPVVRQVSQVERCEPAWHLFALLVDFNSLGMSRAALMNRLKKSGIGSQVHYIPVHMQPFYRKLYPDLRLPGAESYYRSELTLPLFPSMTESDVDYVVNELKSAIE